MRRVFVPEEWEGSPVAGRPASRQMADGMNKQKWRADFVHSERLRGEGAESGGGARDGFHDIQLSDADICYQNLRVKPQISVIAIRFSSL